MYLDYYGLIEKPFSLTPDPKYFFASGCHAQARELLRYGVREREGFLCFVGGAGTGKTTLLRTVLEGFGEDVVTALILNPFLSEEDLLRSVLIDFGVASRDEFTTEEGRAQTKQTLIERLNDHLMRLSLEGKTAVLVIDEAQNLPLPVMEQIRLLSNLETAKSKLLQIVLAGQLGLRTMLTMPELSQLAQRVSVRYTLQRLTPEEIARYLDHRLRIAGSSGEVVFEPEAVDRIAHYSEGVPRLINLLADRTLLAGYAQRTDRLTADTVERAAETLDLNTPGAAPPVEREHRGFPLSESVSGRSGAAGWVGGAAVVACLFAALSWSWLGTGEPQAAPIPRAESPIAASTPPAGALAGENTSLPIGTLPDGEYTVYLSSFRDADDAALRAVRERLQAEGVQSHVIRAAVPGQGTLYRLVVGAFVDRATAESGAARLREHLQLDHAAAVALADVLGS